MDTRQHAGQRRAVVDLLCWQCHRRAILSAAPWPDDMPVPTKPSLRMRRFSSSDPSPLRASVRGKEAFLLFAVEGTLMP
jgi:hypothetical protein